MSIVNDYTFGNMGRIGTDECDLSQRNVQNAKESNYMLTNFGLAECGMAKPIQFATSQPNVFYKGSHHVGLGGCNIGESTELRDGLGLSHPKCKIMLEQRPFATVPYLGRGSSDPVLESQIRHGELNGNRKTLFPASEVSHMNHHLYPLIPSLRSTVSNPANLVEGVAADGWIRGGVPSRELTRDKAYVTGRGDAQGKK